MSESTNALYQALVARLSQITGQSVGDLSGASNYRLLSYLLLLFNNFNGSAGGTGGSTPVASNYAPTYKRTATITPGASGARIVRAEFVTTHAAANGSDIRLFDNLGAPVPSYVYSVQADPSGLKYGVSWQAVLVSGVAASFEIRYGDPNASFARIDQSDFAELYYGARYSQLLAGQALANGPEVAYLPADFETAGVQLYGNRDDVGNLTPTPGPVTFGGVTYTEVFHGPNGSIQFGTAAITSGAISFETSMPNSLVWCSGDLYEVFRREVLLEDGFAWHVRTGPIGYGGGVDLTIRYQNVGIWTVTMLDNSIRTPIINENISIAVGGVARRFLGGPIDRAAPGSALAYRWGLVVDTSSVGVETAIA